MTTQTSTKRGKESYEKAKETARRISAEQSASGRDIGKIPPVKNRHRRDSCERDFERFCKTYLAATFVMPFSADHRKVIAHIEAATLEGGLFPVAMPRGSGKTSLAEAACVWALLYAHRSFVALVGAEEGRACQMLESIKIELEANDLLVADFPKVCHPIRRLERISNRCIGQTYQKVPTYLAWAAGELVLPTIPGSRASGGIAVAKGLTASIRGLKHKRPDGTSIRPDLAVIDDPQTDESARSASQCDARESLLTGPVLGLAGPGKKISLIMPCTVIQRGDLADRMLDRWSGERTKLIYSWPENQALWDSYAQMRAEGMRAGDAGRAATEFYRIHRAEMDRGAVVAWPERYNPDELSAVQHAVNLRLIDPEAFASEYQNEPLPPPQMEGATRIDPASAANRLNGVPRGTLPDRVGTLTGFIDVQQDLLYWAVCGWEEGFTGHLIDYGTFPGQSRPYFRKTDARPPLSEAVGVSSIEGSIWRGLELLVESLLTRPWRKAGGALVPVSRLLVDSGWQADLVYRFCLQGLGKRHAAVLSPSKGIFISAKKTPMADWAPRPPERRGVGWVHRSATVSRPALFLIDTNHWKTFVAARLSQAVGEKGAFFLPGDRPAEHRLFCDHLAAEYRQLRDGVDEWTLDPSRPDNEYLDCYDAETEVLTKDGFRFFRDLSGTEELATVNLETDLIEYQAPSTLIRRVYVGPMVQIGGLRGSRVDLRVTPTHRMVIYTGQASRGPVVREARELTIWDKIKTRATWKGSGVATVEVPATYERRPSGQVCRHCCVKEGNRSRGLCWGCYYVPAVRSLYPKEQGRRSQDAVTVSAKDLAAFLGWYVAEGSCKVDETPGKGKSYGVVISQNPGPKRDSICALLDRLPWKYHTSKTGVVLSNEQAYRLVCNLGNKYTKRVPQWVKDAGPDVIAEFVRCAVDGDGWRNDNEEAYATVSPGLADDMQELYLKLGYGVSCRTRAPAPYCIRGRTGIAKSVQYHVHRKHARFAHLMSGWEKTNFGMVEYDGEVFCATVPNGTLIVRRHGKVAVCGNCLAGSAAAASREGVKLTAAGEMSPQRSGGPTWKDMAQRKKAEAQQAERRWR